MSTFEREVLRNVRDAMDGKVMQIPLHLDRVGEIFAIRKNVYTLIGGGTGSGKTSFLDDTFVLKPYELWRKWKDNTDLTFKVLYRSMERKKSLKLTKWACWKLFQDSGILLDAETLLGYRKSKITEETWKLLVGARDWADEMLDYVDIRDGRTTPDDYSNWVHKYAVDNGVLFQADMYGIKSSKYSTYIHTFSERDWITLKNGEECIAVRITHGDETFVLKQGEKYYVPTRPKEITMVIGDHLGKHSSQKGLTTKKQIIDAVSERNADFRDIYGYSPIAVSQFNRAIGDVQRMKFSDGDLSPQIEDFKDTGNTVEDADLVLALFNPYRYKSYDDHGMYKGYNIRDEMVNPLGYNRYRLLSILKNSYGIDDVDFGMLFRGEVNDFKTLPKANDDNTMTRELQQVYREIQIGK